MYRTHFIAIFLVFNFSLIFSWTINKAELVNRPNETCIIDTNLGTIVGYKQVVLNETINVFYGVPYALPPINGLRFKRAKLIKKFPTQPFEALAYKPHCVQAKGKKFNENDQFEEDCLYMNLWTPNLNKFKKNNFCSKKFDTIIYFYGGKASSYQIFNFVDDQNHAHLSYSGELFSALHEIIFVTINFRQELFSSLYIEDKFPGNLELFDQNLALQWIKQNIESFCGNGEITAVANSLGGMSLGLHLISKYSRDLIKNAIIQSGPSLFQDSIPVSKSETTINSFLAIMKLGCVDYSNENVFNNLEQLESDVKSKYFDLASETSTVKKEYLYKELDKSLKKIENRLNRVKIYSNSVEFVDKKLFKVINYLSKHAVDLKCLRNLNSDQILNISMVHNRYEWQLFIDFDFIDAETYLDYKLFKKIDLNPNLNLLIGGVSDEQCELGVFLKDRYYSDYITPPQVPKEDAQNLISDFYPLLPDKPEVILKMAKYYTDETKWDLPNGYYDSFKNFGEDLEFNCPSHFYATHGAKTANSVQLFRITKNPRKHFGSHFYDLDYAWAGPCHADDLIYIMGLPFRVRNEYTDLDREFSLTLIHLWSAFAKNGKMPTLSNGDKWPVSNKHNDFKISYIEIGGNYIRKRKFEFEERCESLWNPLLPFYMR